MNNERIAIIAVHGIGPAQHYELQDQVAGNLVEHLPGTWTREIFFPPTSASEIGPTRNNAMRVRCTDGDAPVYDVYEAYWSPIDKNRTKALSVLSWLLNAIFAPLNATTPLPASGAKLAFDLSFVGAAVALVFALPLAAFAIAGFVYANLSADIFSGHDVSLVASSRGILHGGLRGDLNMLTFGLHPLMLLAYAMAIFGWFTIYHAVEATIVRFRAGGEHEFGWQHTMRILAFVVGVGLLALSWMMPALTDEHFRFGFEPLCLLAVVLLARLAVLLIRDFFVNRMGDIQIYTTGDQNSVYYDLHNRILQTVEATVLRVLQAEKDGGPLYDRVFVLAHSLGSTIAMDALLGIRQAVAAGALPDHMWNRIAAFITIGTALEKTRFFFAVRKTTLSESFQQWRDDIYGRLFTRDPLVLRRAARAGEHAIFWANYWYLRDVVANRIVTYRCPSSDDASREDSICYNVRLQERGASVLARPWVHSDYLEDIHFWDGVDRHGNQRVGALEILTSSPS
jgi:hypothetical protein